MKKILIGSLSLLFFSITEAQTIEEANKHLYYERYNSAYDAYKSILQQQPNNAAALYGITTAALNTGKVEEALLKLNQSAASLQQEPWFLIAKGKALLASNIKDEAARLFNEAITKTKEKDASILSAVANAHINSDAGDAQYAISTLNTAIKRDKKNPALYKLLGDAYRKAGNSSEAYKLYKQAIDVDPSYAAAYLAVAEIFLSQKNEEMYLDYFNKSIDADQNYAPALEKLYAFYFYKDAARALDYYNRYAVHADKNLNKNYDLADLFYINKKYDDAIAKANEIVRKEGSETKPRIHKLLGYSYAAKGDSSKALNSMSRYFATAHDSILISKDFQIIGDLYLNASQKDSAIVYYTKATEKGEPAELNPIYLRLANMAEDRKDFSAEAKWRELYFSQNESATNVDLFKWALAHYRAEEYDKSAEIFTKYTEKYPDQSYGHYWLARAYSALDTEMEEGLALSHYKKLIELLDADKNNPNYKTWMVEAYGFLAAYEANKEKHYSEAIGYFEKVLEIDPANSDAKKYISILEKADSGK